MTIPMTISGRISDRILANVAAARDVATHLGEDKPYVNVLVNLNIRETQNVQAATKLMRCSARTAYVPLHHYGIETSAAPAPPPAAQILIAPRESFR